MKKCYCFLLCITLVFAAPLLAAEDTAQPITVLTVADIHFDPFISCHKVKPCPLIEKLRREPASNWPALFAKYDVTLPSYWHDSNYSLLTSALTTSKQVATQKDARLVLILGDFLGHEFRYLYKAYSRDKAMIDYTSFVHKTLIFLTDQFAQTFANQNVYLVVGNNDSFQGDYVSTYKGQFFGDIARTWSSLIKDKKNRASMQTQFANGGYYALTLPELPNVRLIVLNTNFFSYKAKGDNVNFAAIAQLNWLHAELQSVQDAHQKAFIALHIPENADIFGLSSIPLFNFFRLWNINYITQMEVELNQFSPSIAMIFAGHLHRNWLEIKNYNKDPIPISGTVSISPIFGNDPGIKLYSFLPDTLGLIDFDTYTYKLNHGREWVKG